MLIMYAVYCVALSFNVKLERWAKSYNIPFLPKDDEPAEESALVSYRSLQEDRLSYTGPNSPVTEQMKNQEGNWIKILLIHIFHIFSRDLNVSFILFQEMAFKKRLSNSSSNNNNSSSNNSHRHRDSLSITKQKSPILTKYRPSWCRRTVANGPCSLGASCTPSTSCAGRQCQIAGKKSGGAGIPSRFVYRWSGSVSIAT